MEFEKSAARTIEFKDGPGPDEEKKGVTQHSQAALDVDLDCGEFGKVGGPPVQRRGRCLPRGRRSGPAPGCILPSDRGFRSGGRGPFCREGSVRPGGTWHGSRWYHHRVSSSSGRAPRRGAVNHGLRIEPISLCSAPSRAPPGYPSKDRPKYGGATTGYRPLSLRDEPL